MYTEKIRIVDNNGIIWYPLQNEGTSDSTSNFIMVSSDGTGIFGNGNTQMLEIIGMNNIATTETFKYQLAVDGENYDTDTIVTATVPYDRAPKNTKVQMTEEFIQKVKVSHITKDGDMLEPAKEVNKIYEVKLMVNDKRITKMLAVSTIALKTAKKLTGSIYVINLKTGTEIKAKYDSKTKSVVFKTKELGNFVIVKNTK